MFFASYVGPQQLSYVVPQQLTFSSYCSGRIDFPFGIPCLLAPFFLVLALCNRLYRTVSNGHRGYRYLQLYKYLHRLEIYL